MSEYRVDALDHDVIVGWDHDRQTFFAEVWDLLTDEDGNRWVYWDGPDVTHELTVLLLAQAIAGYAVLPADIAAQLERDRKASQARASLLKWVRSGLLSLIQRHGCRRAEGSERKRK